MSLPFQFITRGSMLARMEPDREAAAIEDRDRQLEDHLATVDAGKLGVSGNKQFVLHGQESETTDANGDVTITFSTAFSATPTIIPGRVGSTDLTATVITPSSTGFTVRCFSAGTAQATAAVDFNWIAVGDA